MVSLRLRSPLFVLLKESPILLSFLDTTGLLFCKRRFSRSFVDKVLNESTSDVLTDVLIDSVWELLLAKYLVSILSIFWRYRVVLTFLI